MSLLHRNVTTPLNWMIDNLVPPFLRESKLIMQIPFLLFFGKKAPSFMKFKQAAPFLSRREFRAYYAFLADKHIQRSTDLTTSAIRKIVQSVSGETVLDISCGRGFLAQEIVRNTGKHVIGVDFIIPDALQSSHNPCFVEGDIEMIPFADRSFDTVICTHTLEHVQHLELSVNELRRVTRRRLIIVVPRQRAYTYTFDLHLHFFPHRWSLSLITRNQQARCELVGNDIFYLEDIVP